MDARFYTFSKRYNSLSRPSGEGDRVDFLIKSLDSVRNMKIELAFGSNQNSPVKWNYCHLPDFSRYYFVSDWAYQEGLWTASLSEDCLATWADEIRSMSAAVLYSSSSYRTDVLDGRILAGATYTRKSIDYDFFGTWTQEFTPYGTFVLSALSQGISGTGAATTYFMNYGEMSAVARNLLTKDFFTQLEQMFTDPMSAIIDCYYIPLKCESYYNNLLETAVKLGEYIVPGVTAKIPGTSALTPKYFRQEMEIPWILGLDDTGYHPDFRNCEPYTTVELYVPFCGSKALTASRLYKADKINIDYGCDFLSGSVQAIVWLDGDVIAEYSGNIKVPLPIGQIQDSGRYVNAVGGAAEIMLGAGTGNFASMAKGIADISLSLAAPPQINSMGGFGGSVLGEILGGDTTKWQNFRLSVRTHETSATPSSIRSTIGNVCSEVKTISTLSGYCQTTGFSLQAAAYDEELKEVNALMDSGVYL